MLIEVRRCDVTGEDNAEPQVITVGDRRWEPDLTAGVVKELIDLVETFLAPRGRPAVVAAVAPPAASAEGEAATSADLSPDERAACRTWGRRRPKRFGAVGATGRLSQELIDEWVKAGRPG